MENGNSKRGKSDSRKQTKMSNTSVFDEVEDFVKRFHDGDIIITPKAKTLQLEIPSKTLMEDGAYEIRTYTDMLGWAIAAYQYYRDTPELGRQLECAYHLLDLIERGRAYGVIKNLNLTNKLKEYQEQNSQLKEEKDKLQKENQRLKQLNEELHKTLSKFGKAGNIGDVSIDEEK